VTKKTSHKKKKKRRRKHPAGEKPNAFMRCSTDCSLDYSIVYYAFDYNPDFKVKGKCPRCKANRCWVSLLEKDKHKYKFGDRYPSIEERTNGLDTGPSEGKI
jgi:hypothetical protein